MRFLALIMMVYLSIGIASANTVDIAQSLLSAGKLDAASTLLKKETKTYPNDYQLWFLRGVTETKKENYDAAIIAFRKVIELRPDLAEPHNNLAVIYNEKGDLKSAVRELETSLEKRPDYPMAEENIADLYVKLALQAYAKAVAKSDDKKLAGRYALLKRIHDLPDTAVASAAMDKPVTPQIEQVSQPAKGDTDSVLTFVESWRSAWSDQDIQAYFSHYADDFKTPKKYADIKAWKTYKKRVISNKKFIQVTLDHVQVSFVTPESATVTFKQAFRSNSFNSDDNKLLYLKKVVGQWKIVKEVSR